MEKTRLKQAVEPMIAASHRAAIAALAAECAAIEAELERRIAASQERQRTFEILVSLPGIAQRIATLLVTDLPELGHRDRKAIASLAGLAPYITHRATRRRAPP